MAAVRLSVRIGIGMRYILKLLFLSVYAGLAALCILIFVPQFREYLEANGYDTSLMGTGSETSSVASDDLEKDQIKNE